MDSNKDVEQTNCYRNLGCKHRFYQKENYFVFLESNRSISADIGLLQTGRFRQRKLISNLSSILSTFIKYCLNKVHKKKIMQIGSNCLFNIGTEVNNAHFLINIQRILSSASSEISISERVDNHFQDQWGQIKWYLLSISSFRWIELFIKFLDSYVYDGNSWAPETNRRARPYTGQSNPIKKFLLCIWEITKTGLL